jgi:tetratricopeptide (TPR) repeat protein
LEKSIEYFNKALDADCDNINALFSRGACYNRLGHFQKAIDDYYLALDKDSQKGMMRKNFKNIGKVLGLSNDNEERNSKIDNFKYENIDADIQHYVYNNVDIKNTIDSLSSSIQKQNLSAKNLKFEGPMEVNIDLFSNSDSNQDENFIQVKKVEYNEKFSEQIEEPGQDNRNNLKESFKEKIPSNLVLIIERQMELWEVYHSQGYAARKKENFQLAIEFYTKALNLHARYFKALFNRGFAYDKVGEYDKAIVDYTKAIELEPNNAYAYYNRAISFEKKCDIENTLADFTKAISLLPSKIDFYLNRAYVYRKMKDYNSAINDYTEVLRLDPRNIKAFMT